MNFNIFLRAIFAIVTIATGISVSAQALYRQSAKVASAGDTINLAPVAIPAASAPIPTLDTDSTRVDIISVSDSLLIVQNDSIDSLAMQIDTIYIEPKIFVTPLPKWFFRKVCFTSYQYLPEFKPFAHEMGDNEAFSWIEREKASDVKQRMALQRFVIARPDLVPYNLALLPEAPKQYVAKINPQDHTIEIREVQPGELIPQNNLNMKKRHWIRKFEASLQFSQAYISPNWYQGGNNNLNMQFNIAYDVKLNPAFHPNLLFDASIRYKLGLNSAPEDSLRNYSISEDLLQLNATLGYKAARRWYYSMTTQFKTQLLNSYHKNKTTLQSAFLSPGELNVGLGMTYNYANKKKTFTFDASISPLTYNLRICTNMSMNHSDFNIDQDKRIREKFGSSGEFKLSWRLAKNILFASRLFAFTDYDQMQIDWENTLSMDINRFLSTRIYCHLRYDTDTPRIADEPNWHKLQVKEILSFGFAYKFSSL